MAEPLTVRQLKELLENFPDEAIVYSEGCDCTEVAFGVEDYSDVRPQVVIARNLTEKTK